MEGGENERRRLGRSRQEACFWCASRRLASRRECLSDSEEKPPRMAAEANEGGPGRSKQEACFWCASRRLASRRECLSDSEEKPPRMAAKTNEGGPGRSKQEACFFREGQKSSREV